MKKTAGVWKAPEGEGHRIRRIYEGQEIFELYDKAGYLTLNRSLKMELENHNGINFFRVADPTIIFPETAEGQAVNSFSMLLPYKVHNDRRHEHTGLFPVGFPHPSVLLFTNALNKNNGLTQPL